MCFLVSLLFILENTIGNAPMDSLFSLVIYQTFSCSNLSILNSKQRCLVRASMALIIAFESTLFKEVLFFIK